MVYNRHATEVTLRAGALFATLVALAWTLTATHWYVTSAVLGTAALFEIYFLARLSAATNRELARFLNALSFDDATQSFAGLKRDTAFRELGEAMGRVMDQLRGSRAEREEQTRYLQALLAHIPVALVARDAEDRIELLNPAARRLFEAPVATLSDFKHYGEAFATGLCALKAGESGLVRMERPLGPLHMKVAATEFAVRGKRQTLISLQNIASELSAQELAAWQTVIRTMAHEVMNSLTPISSLSATAGDLVRGVRDGLPASDSHLPALSDAVDALDTVARRSAGLMRFVQDHRRLTQQITARPEKLQLARIVARLQRLLAADLANSGIAFAASIEPETLDVVADSDLLDQALINLLRNAMEALRGRSEARIALSAYRGMDGRVVVAVSDNGPGIPPDRRDKVFVPFYTTKREGTGIGLTLVRQIAAIHGASVVVSDTPGGGATVRLSF